MRKQYFQDDNFETMLLSLGLTFTATDLTDKLEISKIVFLAITDAEGTSTDILSKPGPAITHYARHIAITYIRNVYKYLRVSIDLNEEGDTIVFNMDRLEYRHYEEMSKDILELTKILSGLMPVKYIVTVLPKD